MLQGYKVTEKGISIVEEAATSKDGMSDEKLNIADLICSLTDNLDDIYFSYDAQDPEEKAQAIWVFSLKWHGYIERSLVPSALSIVRRAGVRAKHPRLFEGSEEWL